MKQHINLEQLKQLEDIPETLHLFNKKYGLSKQWYVEQLILRPNQDISDAYLRTQCKEINIGRMIEILIDYEPRIDVLNKDDFKVVLWKDTLTSSDYVEYIERELCDALWEAVKYTLKA